MTKTQKIHQYHVAKESLYFYCLDKGLGVTDAFAIEEAARQWFSCNILALRVLCLIADKLGYNEDQRVNFFRWVRDELAPYIAEPKAKDKK